MHEALARLQMILEILNEQRFVQLSYLAEELGVSRMTVRRDLATLSSSVPIYSVRGRGGGITVREDWHLWRMYFTEEEDAFLREIQVSLDAEQQKIMQQILEKFSFPTTCA